MYQQFKRCLIIPILVGISLLSGCQTLIGAKLPISVPGYPIPPRAPNTNIRFDQLSKAEIKEKVQQLILYRDGLERYIEAISELVLHEEYLSKQDRRYACHEDRLIRPIVLPPLPVLDDDVNDDVAIARLIDHIKNLRRMIKRHNDSVKERTAYYQHYCKP